MSAQLAANVGADVLGAYAAALRSFVFRRGLPAMRPSSVPAIWRVVDREPAHAFSDLFTRAIDLSGDPYLGLRFAREIDFARFGLLGVVAAMANDLRGTLGTLISCKAAMSRLGTAQIVTQGKYVDIVWQPIAPMPSAVTEAVLAGWLNFARFIASEKIAVEYVALPSASGRRPGSIETLIDAPVRICTEHSLLRVRREVLDAPSRLADSELFAALYPWLQRKAQLLTADPSGWLAAVQRAMFDAWKEDGSVSELALAERLRVSRRSLQRRLATQHSLRFRDLHDTLRVAAGVSALACRPARQMDVGGQLGFAEHSSFSRAMRDWVGSSPSSLLAWANRAQLRVAD